MQPSENVRFGLTWGQFNSGIGWQIKIKLGFQQSGGSVKIRNEATCGVSFFDLCMCLYIYIYIYIYIYNICSTTF